MTAQGIFTPARLSSLLKPSSTRGTSGRRWSSPSYLGRLRCDGGPLVLAEASGSSITSLCPPFRNFIRHTSSSSVAMVLASRRARTPFASIHLFMLANLLAIGDCGDHRPDHLATRGLTPWRMLLHLRDGSDDDWRRECEAVRSHDSESAPVSELRSCVPAWLENPRQRNLQKCCHFVATISDAAEAVSNFWG